MDVRSSAFVAGPPRQLGQPLKRAGTTKTQTTCSCRSPRRVAMVRVSRMPGFGAAEELERFLAAASGKREPQVELIPVLADGRQARRVVVHPTFDEFRYV